MITQSILDLFKSLSNNILSHMILEESYDRNTITYHLYMKSDPNWNIKFAEIKIIDKNMAVIDIDIQYSIMCDGVEIKYIDLNMVLSNKEIIDEIIDILSRKLHGKNNSR